ncbi:LytTR family DNA-binding domain-containing protein [Oceanihabitans sp. 2_MG-2023]|uniref:LytR/AlgR family response regulator transcription factor n=1 Tax=Oceanihabitans sp. 2_MG-2023 TaxID=3062661 RepID=UPI0026E31FDA|nr:LytTR family DNA-binding domain-containing protein [Oceanihabitans sp. 2_MG-2023]MDO6598171.1 LytTR family DNA-binding domain-containing protein [Oceanihabitans sp. 2_MG-2023]
MIKILIIEDEIPARKKLKRFLEALETKTKIVAEIDTVETAIEFLSNFSVDIIFSDIELLDGNAFEIFERVQVSCPIIFTTAYDQFLMNAFESNGIAYLLKPFSKDRFQIAWDKFLLLKTSYSNENLQLNKLTKLIQQNFEKNTYKKRFTINTHQGIYFLDTENITFFEASEGVIFAYDIKGKKHLLNKPTLSEIEKELNTEYFFRINRSTLVNKQHVEKIERYNKNILAIKIKAIKTYFKTSQSKTASFRKWIEK